MIEIEGIQGCVEDKHPLAVPRDQRRRDEIWPLQDRFTVLRG